MPPPVEKRFLAKLQGALAGEKANLALKKLINHEILGEQQLLACLTAFCRNFDAKARGLSETRRQYGLILCYTLFSRSIALAGQLDGLIELIPRMSAPRSEIDRLHASRWMQMPPGDRERLGQEHEKKRKELRDRRTLVTPLLQAYAKAHPGGRLELWQLYAFDAAPDTPRKPFEEVATRCAERWGKFGFHSGHMKPSPENLQLLDDAFAAFATYLKDVAGDPLVFFQVLKWIREGGEKVLSTVVGGKKYYKATPAWSTVWEELYLEGCVHAVAMAPDRRWNLITLQKAKGLPPEDYDFFVEPLPSGGLHRAREKLDARLSRAVADVAGTREMTRYRRRYDRYATYSGFELLDEFETVELQNGIEALRRAKPEVIAQRYARTASERLVFNDTYRVDQAVLDEFTIIWIETVNGQQKVIVEFHSMDCVLFRMDTGHLRAAVEQAFYKALAKNAEALKAFLLRYLEALGLALDIATAGMAGGFRRAVFVFVKERLKDKATDVALDTAGVDNEFLRLMAGMAANTLRLPKRSPRATTDTGIADTRATHAGTSRTPSTTTTTDTGFDPKLQRATTDDPFRPHTDAEKAALQRQDVVGAERFEARREQLVRESRQESQGAVTQASVMSGTRTERVVAAGGGGGRVVVANAPTVAPTTRTLVNGVDPRPSGLPSNASRGTAALPRAVPANGVDETVQRVLGERNVPNPPGSPKRSVEAPPTILDAESRRVLGETLDLNIAGTGGIDQITARATRGGELTVKIEGILLPDRLTREANNVGGMTTMAPNFNNAGPSNQFRIEEMEIRGPKNEPVTMQRAHLWGPGFGDEAAAGMFLAPSKINLEWQNQMAERYLRDLATRAGAKGGFVRLEATATSWGKEVSLSVGRTGEKFLKQIKYDIELHMPGKPVRRASVILKVPKPPVPDAVMDQRHVRGAIGKAKGDDLMQYVR